MKVGFITQWYDPEGGSALTFGNIARGLSREGLDVEVLTGLPNYPQGTLYPGYRVRPYLREYRDGMVVHRSPLYPSHDARALKRAMNYLSFGTSSTVVGMRHLRHSEVNLAVPSPPTAALAALALRKSSGTPFGIHIHDLWPDSMMASGMVNGRAGRAAFRGLGSLCNVLYEQASFVAVTSPGMVEVLRSRGVTPSKLALVPNWADESIFEPVPHEGRSRDECVLMYAGAVGDVQGLDNAVRAMVGLPPALRLHIVGDGPARTRLQALSRELELDSVVFRDAVPPREVPGLLAEADVQIASLADLPLFEHTMPSKIANALASGVPVVAAVAGDAAQVVRKSGAGLVTRPGDVDALRAAFLRMAAMSHSERRVLGRAGRAYYEREMSESVVLRRLSSLLADAARTTT